MTSFVPLTHIFVVNADGSGHLAAVGHTLEDAVYISSALEDAYPGSTVVIDPPTFGLMQNILKWSPRGFTDAARAVPWRDFLVERAKHDSLRETFAALYQHVETPNGYDRWEMR